MSRSGAGEGEDRVDERHHGQWVADNAMKTEAREENSCRSATSFFTKWLYSGSEKTHRVNLIYAVK